MPRRRMRALAAAAMLVTLSVVAADAALADDAVSPPVVITINGLVGPTTIQVQDGAQFLPPPTPAPVESQCFGVAGTVNSTPDTLCLGASGSDTPLKVNGPWDPFIPAGWDAKNALRWIVDEAVAHLRLHHGLPLDYRIERLAPSEIRAYLVQRVLGILDKSVHGVELTNNEQLTLTLIQQRILEADRRISDFAYGEYQNWSAQRCGYHPPTAPAFVTTPVLLPDNVWRYCNVLQPRTAVAFEFAPPIPSVSDFMAWGFYRHAQTAGISALGDPGAQKLLQDMLAAGVVLGSFAAAAAAGAGAAAMVGSSAALSAAVATAVGSTVAGSAAAAAYPASALSAMIASTGASAAGWVVAIVVVGIVVTAVSIVQFVEYQSIGAELLARKDKAALVTDPFNLHEQLARYGGTPIGTGWNDRLPSHRSTAVTTRLRQLLFEWTTIDTAGVFHPDATGLWPDNATDTSTDIHFEVKVDGGPFVPVASIELPQPAGEPSPLELRFDQAWPILTAPDDSARATLTIPFVNAAGKLVYASRLADNQFVLGEVESMRTGAGMIVPEISFLDADGRVVIARLVDPLADDAAGAGVRPAAVGMMLPDRPVRLRPNPLTATGAFFPPDEVDDLTFDWTVHRFDPATGAWLSVADLTGSSPSFIPDDVGSYYAEVVRTGDGHHYRGSVDFEIVPPDISVDVLRLDDDGYDTLKLMAAFSESVLSDDLTVTVRWPGMRDTPEAELPSFDLVCGDHNGACATTANPSGAQIAQYQLDLDTVDLNESVVVTVTNSWGVVAQRTLPLDPSVRPALSAPASAPAADGDAVAEFSDGVIFLQVPIATDRFQNVTLATITLPAGEGPGAYFHDSSSSTLLLSPTEYLTLTPAAAGTVELSYTGIPSAADLGLTEDLLTVVSGSSATTVLLRREVVPAVDGKFRAAAAFPAGWDEHDGTIPLVTPIVLGGMAEWSGYDGDICVELTNSTATPPTTHQSCAPLSSFVDLDTQALTELSFASLLPAGFTSGLWSVKSWLPVPEDSTQAAQVSAAPTHTTFRVTSDAPRVTLVWDGATKTMNRTTTLQPGGPALTGFACTLDGSTIDCFDSGDGWILDGLSDGIHELRILVTDASGNYSTSASMFRVGDAPVPGGGGGPTAQKPSSSRTAHLLAERGGTPLDGAPVGGEPVLPQESTQDESFDDVDQPTDADESSDESSDDRSSDAPPADPGMPWFAIPLGLVLLTLLAGGGVMLFRRRAAGY